MLSGIPYHLVSDTVSGVWYPFEGSYGCGPEARAVQQLTPSPVR